MGAMHLRGLGFESNGYGVIDAMAVFRSLLIGA
jgi:hypothetical protein